MTIHAAELSDEARVGCRAFMRQRFPGLKIRMSRKMGDAGGYGFNSADILTLLSFVEVRLRGLPTFAPHAALISISGGTALVALVDKTLSEVADHAVNSIARSLAAGGVVVQ